MEVIKVDLNDVFVENSIADVSSITFQLVIALRKQYPDGPILITNGLNEVTEKFPEVDAMLMQKFGVFFECYNEMINYEYEARILFINASDSIPEDYSKFWYCYVTCNSNEELDVSFVEEIISKLPGIRFLNDSFECIRTNQLIDSQMRGEAIGSIDIGEIIGKVSYNAISYLEALQSLQRAFSEIENINSDAVISCKLDRRSEVFRKQEALFLSIAAYFTLKEGRKFVVPESLYDEYLYHVKRFSQQSYNYANDYFSYLADAPNFGVLKRNNLNCLAVKNEQLATNSANYRIGACVHEFVYSEEYGSVTLVNKQPVNIYYDEVDLLSIREKFNLHNEDSSTSMQGFRQLTKLFAKMDKEVRKNVRLTQFRSVNVTNTLYYRREGVTYFAVVMKWVGAVPYRLFPLTNKKYDFVNMEMSIDNITNLSDITLVEGAMGVAKKFVAAGISSGVNRRPLLAEHSKGFLIQQYAPVKTLFPLDCGFTLEEIGFWSFQASSGRSAYVAPLLKSCTAKGLWEIGYFTCFGGPNPAYKTSFAISPEMRRI